MSLRSAATKGVSWMLLSSAAYFAFSLASSFVLPRILLPVDYGVYASAQAVITYLTFVSDLGVTPAAIQAKNLDKATFSTAFTMKIIAAGSSFIAVVALAPLASWYFGNQSVGAASIALGLNFLIGAVWFPQNIKLNRGLEFRVLFYLGLVSSAGIFVIAVSLALNHFAFWSLVLSAVGSGAIVAALAVAFVRSPAGIGFDKRIASDLWRFGKNITLASAVGGILVVGVGTFVIGGILGLAALGFYAVAAGLSGFVSTGVSVIDTVFFPVFSRLNRSGTPLKDSTMLVIEYASWLVFPAVVGLEALGPQVIVLVLGHGTEKWASSILPFQLLLVGQVLNAFSIPLSDYFKAVGQTHFLRTASIMSAVTYLPLLYLATTEFQLLGAALASVYATAVIFIVYAVYGRPTLGISLREIGKMTARPLVASLICYPLVAFLNQRVGSGYVGLVDQAVIGLACYVAIMSVWTRGTFLVRLRDVLRDVFQ